jgi:hypothetical protein
LNSDCVSSKRKIRLMLECGQLLAQFRLIQ